MFTWKTDIKWTLKLQDIKVWIGFIWLKMVTVANTAAKILGPSTVFSFLTGRATTVSKDSPLSNYYSMIIIIIIIIIKKITEALVVASKETGLEVNAGKTKYMVLSRDQNVG